MGSLKLTTASSGSVILSPANTASDVTITVPAVTGTMLTNKTAGTVLQVVSATSATQESTTSTTNVNSSYQTASITPLFSTSKILVIVTTQIQGNAINDGGALGLSRNSTLIGNNFGWLYNTSSINTWVPASFSYLDSPSTTSSTTYTVNFRSYNGATFKISWGSGSISTITLMEIAA